MTTLDELRQLSEAATASFEAAMRDAITQARGALTLDTMRDDKGAPYGTTMVAFEALARAEAALDRASIPPGFKLVPVEPTEEMHHAARDWSYAKYGKPIGKDASAGCWAAMIAAAPSSNGED